MTSIQNDTPTRIRPLRTIAAIATLAGATLLAGCSGLQAVSSSVVAYGTWPADKTPGTFSFDRLPSQAANPARQASLEAVATQALTHAGFRPVAAGAPADVTVQIGARIERFETSPWDDPFWMPGRYRGFGFGNPWAVPYGPYGFGGPYGPFWHPWAPQPDQYQREVALLIRDAASGKPLYEARATSGGFTEGGPRLLGAMFEASMSDFPHPNEKPHDVTVPLEPLAPTALSNPDSPVAAPAGVSEATTAVAH